MVKSVFYIDAGFSNVQTGIFYPGSSDIYWQIANDQVFNSYVNHEDEQKL
jgi:hypothetical protein